MKKLSVLIFFILLTTGKLETQNSYWDRVYDSKDHYYEDINDMKIDSFGNIYITGQSGGNGTAYDYVTIKYNSTGNLQWLSRFDNSISNYNLDVANALALDNQGNVFVTGMSIKRNLGSGIYDYDFVTVKYDNIGVQQWTAIHDSSGAYGAVSIATDKNGFIYVIGTESFSGNMATIKYDQNGNIIWIARTPGSAVKIIIDGENNIISACDYSTKLKLVKYNQNGLKIWEDTVGFSNSYAAYVKGLTVDNSNNVILVGKTYISSANCSAIKWNKYGQRLWILNGGANYSYNAVVTDKSQNIYITGQNNVCYTIKINPEGNILWEKLYDYAGRGDAGVAIALDNDSNICVADVSWGSIGICMDYNVIKYSYNGSELWVRRYNGPASECDEVSKIAIDQFNNVVLGGHVGGIGTLWDYGIVKYEPSGNFMWSGIYQGPPSDEYAKSIQIDDSGNVFATGYGWGNESGFDYLTLKYNSTGVQQWIKRFDGISHDSDIVSSSTIDLNNRLYITGGSKSGLSGFDYLTLRYNGSGIQDLQLNYNGPGNGEDIANLILTDNSGNIYVTGKSFGAGSDHDYATLKYNGNGIVQWISRYNGIGNSTDEATSMIIDDIGNVYVTGKSTGSGTGYDYLTIKYNSTGVQQWLARYNGTGNTTDEAVSIAIDSSGNVYVTGKSEGLGSSFDCVTVKYNSNGIQQWIARYNGSGNSVDEGKVIEFDGNGNIYVLSDSENTSSGFDIVLLKYDVSGNIIWSKSYNGQFNGSDFGNSMIIDLSGNVFVGGETQKNSSNYSMVILKFTSIGNIINTRNISSAKSEKTVLINSDISQNIFIVGNSQDSAFFSLDPNTGSNIYISKLSHDLNPIFNTSTEISKQFILSQNYPNPFNPQTKIKFAVPSDVKGQTTNVKLVIYDLLGREVATLVNEELKPGTYEADWDASNFSSGVYFYKIISNEFVETKKMVLMK